MRAIVTSEVTELTVTIEVSDVPDIDITQRWHTRDRSFRPEALVIRATNGEFSSVEVRGGQMLMSGQPSENVVGKKSWYAEQPWHAQSTWLKAAPDWVQNIVGDVLYSEDKVTTWASA
jgi:hypothetical protein